MPTMKLVLMRLIDSSLSWCQLRLDYLNPPLSAKASKSMFDESPEDSPDPPPNPPDIMRMSISPRLLSLAYVVPPLATAAVPDAPKALAPCAASHRNEVICGGLESSIGKIDICCTLSSPFFTVLCTVATFLSRIAVFLSTV